MLIQKNGLISRTYTCTTSDIACLCYYEDFSITKHLPDYAQNMKGTITVNIKAYIQNRLQREVTYKVDRNAPEAWIIFYSDKSYLCLLYTSCTIAAIILATLSYVEKRKSVYVLSFIILFFLSSYVQFSWVDFCNHCLKTNYKEVLKF